MFTKFDMTPFIGEELRGDLLGRESFGRRSLRRISQAVKSKVSRASRQGSLDLEGVVALNSIERDGTLRASFRYKDEKSRVPARALDGEFPRIPSAAARESKRWPQPQPQSQPQEDTPSRGLPRRRWEGGVKKFFLRPAKALPDGRRKDSWKPSGRRMNNGRSRPRRMSIDEAELLSLKRKLEGDLVMKAYHERRVEFINNQTGAMEALS